MFYDITWSVQSFHVDKFLLLCILDSRKNHPTVFSVQCIKRASNTVCSRCVTFCPRMLLLCLRCTRCTASEYWGAIDAPGILHQKARDTMYQNSTRIHCTRVLVCAGNAADVVQHQNARDTGAGPWCDSTCDGVTPDHPLTCHTRSLSLFIPLYAPP